MTGAELADELSSIGDAYCSDARVAWQLARFVNANMAAILAALRSERPAVDVQGAADVGADALSEPQLHEMMRDPRYWRQRDPEFIARVTSGFKRLYGGDEALDALPRPEAEVGAVERAGYALYLADPRAVVYKSWAQLSDKLKEHYGSRARAALAAAQEG